MIGKTGEMQEPSTKLESERTDGDSIIESPSESPQLIRTETVFRSRSMNFAQQGKFTYPSGSTPLPGYTIKRGIGSGGFGEVYFALSDAGKEVALKRIQRNLDIELRGVRQCLNLKHLNLISLWDIRSNEAGESWVVMEYVPGPSLRDLIESHPGGIPKQQVEVWFSSTAAGVAYLHDQGIVHRDLKPANIFFDEDQQVIKIGDYGLSKFISCSRRSGQTETVGTFHYMAPEIGKGIYGKEIDIYALGILLFEMLTGDVPFKGESTQEIIMKHLTADPELDLLPDEFRDVLRRSMKKDPQHRFSNVHEMIDALPWSNTEKRPKSQTANAQVDSTEFISGILIDDVNVELVREGIVLGPLQETKPEVKQEMIQFIETRQAANYNSTTVAGNPEPIAEAVKGGFSQISNWWYTATLSTPVKVIILIAAAMFIMTNTHWLLPVSLVLGGIYLAYYAIRSLFIQPQTNRTEGLAHPATWVKGLDKTIDSIDQALAKDCSPTHQRATPRQATKRESQKREQEFCRQYLAKQTAGVRITELFGSMLIATIACILFNLLAINLGERQFEGTLNLETLATYGWLTLSAITACWGLLITSKCWEHRQGDAWLRRLTMCGIGCLTGLASFSLASFLHLDLTNPLGSLGESSTTDSLANYQGTPLMKHLLIFTLLFALLRWWKQADPVRKTRLSIWSVGSGLIWVVILSYALGTNPFWYAIIALAISSSTQLGAPWLSPSTRREIVSSFMNETRAA